MRLIFPGLAAVCFVLGTVCFGICFVRVAWFVTHPPSVEEGLREVTAIQSWGWWFLGFCVTGFVILVMVPDGPTSKIEDAKQGEDLGRS